MFLEYLKIFFIGILEDFLLSFNTKAIQRNNLIFSFVIAFLSAIIWYYVIVMVVENINKFWLVLVYACGGGLGDVITISLDKHIQRFEKVSLRVLNKCLPRRKKKRGRSEAI